MDKYKISKIILFLFVMWIFISILTKGYVSTTLWFGAVMAIIVLLVDFVEFVKKYRNKILIVVVVMHCSLTFLCLFKFSTHEYVNLASAYINVVLLETKDYQMISKPGHSKEYIEDINASYSVKTTGNTKDTYRYVIKNTGTIDDKMATISNFIYTIEKYQLSHGNTYRLYVKIGDTKGVLYVTMEDYSQFTIVKFG